MLTCSRSTVNCEEFNPAPCTGPKVARKSVEAIGETREVMFEKVVRRRGRGAS